MTGQLRVAAGGEEIAVGSGDELLQRVALTQFAESERDRVADMQLGAKLLDTPPRLGQSDARQYAEELVTAKAHEEIVGAHLTGERVGHVPKQLVPGMVALSVVARLQVVHVDVGHGQLGVDPARSVDLLLKLLEPRAPAESPGELVGRRQLAVSSRVLAVPRRLLAISGRVLAVVSGPQTRRGRTITTHLSCHRVPVEDAGAPIEPECLLVSQGSRPIALSREIIALLCRCIASVGGPFANLSGVHPLPGGIGAHGGRSSGRGRVRALLAPPG